MCTSQKMGKIKMKENITAILSPRKDTFDLNAELSDIFQLKKKKRNYSCGKV